MASYSNKNKNELIQLLQLKDEEIKGLNKQIGEKDSKISGFGRDCECMTEECNNLRNKVNGLSDDLKKSNEICENLTKDRDAFRVEKNAAKTMVEQKEEIISTLKRQRVILGIVTIAAIIIAIVF